MKFFIPGISFLLPFLATLFIVSLISGCVIPIPVGHVDEREFGRSVDEQSVLVLTKGKTTRKEVLLRLGQPDGFMDEERTFFYIGDATNEGYRWSFLIIAPGGFLAVPQDGTSGPQPYEKYRLTIWFDVNGLVKDYKFERTKAKE